MRPILFFFFFVLILSLPTSAQDIQEYTDPSGQKQLQGKANRKALKGPTYAWWFNMFYNSYEPDSVRLDSIKSLLTEKKIRIFMGTWCDDSRREVSRFFKILDRIGYSSDSVQLIMVTNKPELYKQSPQHEEKGLNISLVPTFIIESAGKEVGRIVETPKLSLEKDLLEILRVTSGSKL